MHVTGLAKDVRNTARYRHSQALIRGRRLLLGAEPQTGSGGFDA